MGFDDIALAAENTIDDTFGITLTVKPYKAATQMLDAPIPDPARTVRTVIGYRVSRWVGLRAAGADFASNQLITRRAEADHIVAIQDRYVPDIAEGDHIVVKGAEHVISYIEPGANGRSIYHLLKYRT